jgi:hypothetical protein
MAYSNEEKETTCVFDYEKKEWNVYTCVPTHLNKLGKIAAPYWIEEENGRIIAAKWKLKGNQVRFAMEIVTKMSDGQKQAARQRMIAMHEKQTSTVSK